MALIADRRVSGSQVDDPPKWAVAPSRHWTPFVTIRAGINATFRSELCQAADGCLLRQTAVAAIWGTVGLSARYAAALGPIPLLFAVQGLQKKQAKIISRLMGLRRPLRHHVRSERRAGGPGSGLALYYAADAGSSLRIANFSGGVDRSCASANLNRHKQFRQR